MKRKRAPRNANLNIKVNDDERRRLRDLAVHHDMSASAVVRRLIADAHRALHSVKR